LVGRGEQKLTGETLKVVLAHFSTLSWPVGKKVFFFGKMAAVNTQNKILYFDFFLF
jgi:hypothetical protein